jgi:hypothetical protein
MPITNEVSDRTPKDYEKSEDLFFWEKRICVSAAVGVLAVAAALFRYAYPVADDFARGYKGRAQGIVPATIYEYYTWTGRWAACGLSYFLTA